MKRDSTPVTKANQTVASFWSGFGADDFYARFTHDGEIEETDMSPKYEPEYTGRLVGARSHLVTVGSPPTVTVYRNGSSIGTITWAGTESERDFDHLFVADTDILQVQVTDAGSGALGISIRFKFIKENA